MLDLRLVGALQKTLEEEGANETESTVALMDALVMQILADKDPKAMLEEVIEWMRIRATQVLEHEVRQ